MSDSKEYYIGVSIHNCFYVTAESEAEALAIVEGYDAQGYLDECELVVNYVDEVTA
jgi:hypothetical protein